MNKRITLIETFPDPITGAKDAYNFKFSVTDLVDNNSSTHEIKVGISSTMKALWKNNQENINVEKACYEYGKNEIKTLLKNQILLDKQDLEILTTNHPKECPFITDKIDYRLGVSEDFDID